MKIHSREETYSDNKYFGSFLYWEFIDMVSSIFIFVIQLWILKWLGAIDFVYNSDWLSHLK